MYMSWSMLAEFILSFLNFFEDWIVGKEEDQQSNKDKFRIISSSPLSPDIALQRTTLVIYGLNLSEQHSRGN